MIWPCKSVFPDIIHWNYTVENTCYEYTPAKINDSLFFIIPGSRDLTSHSPIIPCGHHLMGIHRTSGSNADGSRTWVSPSGPTAVTEVPIQLIWKNLWIPFTFNTPALFHDHLTGYTTNIGMISSYVYRIATMEYAFQHLVNYTAQFSTDPEIVLRAFNGIGNGINHAINSTETYEEK